jgi:hypothetical protein
MEIMPDTAYIVSVLCACINCVLYYAAVRSYCYGMHTVATVGMHTVATEYEYRLAVK